MSILSRPSPQSRTALFRTSAIAGSALIWGVFGYLALTYVPKIMPPKPIIDVTIEGVTPVPPEPPPPPIVKDTVKLTPDTPPVTTTQTTPTLTVRPTTPNTANPLQGEFQAGPPPLAPATGTETLNPPTVIEIAPPEPIVVPTLVEPEVTPPPPAPRLVINPVRVSGANPMYPPRALERDIMGEVTLSFTVSASGSVENIQIADEQPKGYGFARAARDAISGWRFQPQTIDGVAVAYPARYTFSFKLED
jgi:periplasmic protein TonB